MHVFLFLLAKDSCFSIDGPQKGQTLVERQFGISTKNLFVVLWQCTEQWINAWKSSFMSIFKVTCAMKMLVPWLLRPLIGENIH